jgi:hypothetical protein
MMNGPAHLALMRPTTEGVLGLERRDEVAWNRKVT